MKKRSRSLQFKYMLLIFSAIVLVQVMYLASAILMAEIDKQLSSSLENNADYIEIERNWHQEVAKLSQVDEQSMQALFEQWSATYPESSMFWVNEQGQLASSWKLTSEVPTEWTSAYTVSFMKERYGGNPFTVVALVGRDATQGFAVLEIPRSVFESSISNVYAYYGNWLILFVFIIVVLFIVISYLFFRRLRQRLLQLQQAMNNRNTDGLPVPVTIRRMDEIGELQDAFNQMVNELRESKQREQEEEKIRRDLIASLSHDLRTPLTKIQSNAYSLSKLELPRAADESILALQKSVTQIDSLIENLMSYTLLISHKYKLNMKEVNMIRFIREHMATWYASFEKEDFQIDVSLEGMTHQVWKADPMWLGRIMDNVFQNVLRHASSGKYISISVCSTNEVDAIIISDKGGGLEQEGSEKGAGIGLSIVDMMVKEMNLLWTMESSKYGLTVTIMRARE